MADAGVCPLGQADVAVLARVSGIALSAYRLEHVARSVSRVVGARHGLRSGTELARLCQPSPAARAELRLRQCGALPGSRLLGSDLRAAIRWECRDLVRDPAPAGLFDLVLCRNVAIYLAAGAQQALHATLAAALRRGGVLLLGRSERLLRPEQFGLAPPAPHAYRKEAACGAA